LSPPNPNHHQSELARRERQRETEIWHGGETNGERSGIALLSLNLSLSLLFPISFYRKREIEARKKERRAWVWLVTALGHLLKHFSSAEATFFAL
jgi:hypothetical protein